RPDLGAIRATSGVVSDDMSSGAAWKVGWRHSGRYRVSFVHRRQHSVTFGGGLSTLLRINSVCKPPPLPETNAATTMQQPLCSNHNAATTMQQPLCSQQRDKLVL